MIGTANILVEEHLQLTRVVRYSLLCVSCKWLLQR